MYIEHIRKEEMYNAVHMKNGNKSWHITFIQHILSIN